MEKVVFQSALTEEQIEENFKDVDFFSGMMDGLQEALAYRQGKAKRETIARKRALPNVKVAEVRKSLDMTQKVFAETLGVSCRTVEAWESGKTNPTPTAKKLMFLIQDNPELVQKLRPGT